MTQPQPKITILTPDQAKAMERSALARIKKQNQAIVLRPSLCFFASLVLRLKPTVAWWMPTAATDGKHLFYNPAYVESMSDSLLRGLVIHEVLHCANGHIWRRDNRNQKDFNIACDYAIDPIIVGTRFGGTGASPTYLEVPDALIDARFKGKSAEQIYAILREERSTSPKLKHSGPGGEGEPEDQGGEDDQPSQGGGQPGQKPGKGKGQTKPASAGHNGLPQPQDVPADPRAPNYKPTKGEIIEPPQAEAAKTEIEWRQAVIQAVEAAKAQGNLPAGIERLVEEFVQPHVDWKSVLRRFVQQLAALDYDFRRPSGRYLASGLYMPKLRSETMPPIVIGVDTSGSIGQQELAEFAAEMTSIIEEVKPEVAHVVYCDAAVGSVQEFVPGDPLVYKPTGGGGTDFVPVFKWVEEQGIEPACLIYLTDCMGDYPEELPPYPVLWASSTKEPGRYAPPFGEFLYIGE